jgi:hypothetical protein
LFFAVAIPSFATAPETGARTAVWEKMSDVETAVAKFGAENGHYPRDVVEVMSALKNVGPLGLSRYQRDGRPVEFLLSTHMDATGPVFDADQPGAVVYAVNKAGNHYWITGSMLPAATSQTVVPLQRFEDKSPWVLTAEVEPPSPAVAPAKAKIEPKK